MLQMQPTGQASGRSSGLGKNTAVGGSIFARTQEDPNNVTNKRSLQSDWNAETTIGDEHSLPSLNDWLLTRQIAVVGLGYVGLPLAVEFGKHFTVMGFDVKKDRVEALRRSCDETLETSRSEIDAAEFLGFTSELDDISGCNVFIVAVPTPIDKLKRPDLGPLQSAAMTVGSVLKPGDLVVFESTVYPGCTEEECIPVLESQSGLKANKDFFVGYSPERVNPGDRDHRLTNVVKITSGSCPQAADMVDALYASIVSAGTFRAESIKVAEAAKVIENTQRDLNIALVNELSIIFNRIGIDTMSVLEAASTKWNFLPFKPGLVGGHCIGVDPYYLTHKAEDVGYRPEIILAGRRLNDSMGSHIASRLIIAMAERGMTIQNARVLMLGLTFKENCPDLRNSLVIDTVRTLETYGCHVDVHDPVAMPHEARGHYGVELMEVPPEDSYDAVVLAVGHEVFREAGASRLRRLGRRRHVFFDVKNLFPATDSDLRL